MYLYDEEVIHPPVVEQLRLAVRERPVADEDMSAVQVVLKTNESKLVAFQPNGTEGMMYDYDYFYPRNARQEDLFRTIGLEMVDVCIGGLSTNCVTFGLAETGKTHSLFGSQNESGLIQDTVYELFQRLERQASSHDYQVTLRYWEMNRDSVQDNLVDDGAGSSKIAVSSNAGGGEASSSHSIFRNGFGQLYVSNVVDVEVRDFDDFEMYLNRGNENRIRRGCERMARWHAFVQLSVTTTDKARGEKCVLRNMTFAHVKGPERVGANGARGQILREGCRINVSMTLLCAGVIHSLEYREKRQRNVRTKKDLYNLIRKSQSFFMECKFSQVMSQLICGHEACFMLGCVDPLKYGETVETLENLQLFRQLTCACIPIITSSEKGCLLRKLHRLERQLGGAEVLAMMSNDSCGRPLTEEEEELLRLRGRIEGWEVRGINQAAVEREEELKQRSRARLQDILGGGGVNFATHGDRNKIYLNPAKTATYEGQWADGVFDGFGEHVQGNFKYRGEFRKGKREGDGTLFIRRDKGGVYTRVYQGEWLGGMRDGRGTQWCPNGDVYEGEFCADKRRGHGKLYLANANVIEGHFVNDLCDGWAVLRMSDGNWFEGYWSQGVREGPGVFHYVHRMQCLRGEWSKDVPRMGVLEDEPDKMDSTPSGFIPRTELLNYEDILGKEREKLNEARHKEFRSKGKVWLEYTAPDVAASHRPCAADDAEVSSNEMDRSHCSTCRIEVD